MTFTELTLAEEVGPKDDMGCCALRFLFDLAVSQIGLNIYGTLDEFASVGSLHFIVDSHYTCTKHAQSGKDSSNLDELLFGIFAWHVSDCVS